MEGGGGPAWLSILLLAETWGTTPWGVYGLTSPTAWDRWKWIIRQRELMNQRAKKSMNDAKQLERESKRR